MDIIYFHFDLNMGNGGSNSPRPLPNQSMQIQFLIYICIWSIIICILLRTKIDKYRTKMKIENKIIFKLISILFDGIGKVESLFEYEIKKKFSIE